MAYILADNASILTDYNLGRIWFWLLLVLEIESKTGKRGRGRRAKGDRVHLRSSRNRIQRRHNSRSHLRVMTDEELWVLSEGF
ncbi:unnamed protein product [Rhodiola kirilowii]